LTQEDVRVRGDGSSAAMAAAREELARRLELVTRVMLRPMASPMPIGFVGLAATVVVASMNLGWISSSQAHQVAIVLIAFVFPLQAVTSIFGVLTRDGVAGTAMAILAGTWLTVGLVMLTSPLDRRARRSASS